MIKGPEVLENTRTVDTVVLDKTGTVTTGVMDVLDVIAAEGYTGDEVLRMAAAVEAGSEHPIAAAICRFAVARLGDVPAATSMSVEAGVGARGIGGWCRRVRVGRGDAGALDGAKAGEEAGGRTVVTVTRRRNVVLV